MGTLIAVVVAVAVLFFVGVVSNVILVPFINATASALTNWISIPVVNQVIFWGQAIAVVLAIAIRVFVGIKDGIFQNGGPRMASLGEYAFRSIAVIALIGLTPVICNLVMLFGQNMFADVSGLAKNVVGTELIKTGSLEWSSLDVDMAHLDQSLTNFVNAIPAAIITTVCLFMAVRIVFQMFKRQVEMLVASVAAPWITLKSATESDSNAAGEFLVNLFGMCCMQWLQYLFLMVGVAMLNTIVNGNNVWALSIQGQEAWVSYMLTVAVFGAAGGVPQLLNRFTFVGGSTRGGGLAAGALGRVGSQGLKALARAARRV